MIIHEEAQVIPQEYYSSSLSGMIQRMLEKNPRNRPTANEVLILASQYLDQH